MFPRLTFQMQHTVLGEWREDHANSDGVASSRYRRLRLHAKGGIGEIFIAETKRSNREVALEEIQPHFSRDPASRSRFLAEEKSPAAGTPGIVPVYGLENTTTVGHFTRCG